MLKKAIYTGAGLALLSAFFFGRDAVSYVGTSACWVKDSVKGSVPIEFEIERARKLVRDLVPDIRSNMHLVAKEEAEVERLDKQIVEAEERLAGSKGEILRLKDDLSSGKAEFSYAGRSYSADQVRINLANRFDRYKTQDATLVSLRQMRDVRTQSLGAAKEKLEAMLVAKRQLALDVENLEARLKMLEAKQATSEYQFDDSRLSRAKGLISELRSRLTVEEKLINAEGVFEEIQLDQPDAENIVEEVTAYFDGQPSDDAAAQPAEELAVAPAIDVAP